MCFEHVGFENSFKILCAPLQGGRDIMTIPKHPQLSPNLMNLVMGLSWLRHLLTKPKENLTDFHILRTTGFIVFLILAF